jgi:hypothetical protein
MIVRILAGVRATMNEVARMSGGQGGTTAAKKMNTGRADTANRAERRLGSGRLSVSPGETQNEGKSTMTVLRMVTL